MTVTIGKIAAELMSAHESGESLPVVSSRYPEIDIDAAYLIQAAIALDLSGRFLETNFPIAVTQFGLWNHRLVP